jgi:alanyl-tRNA synthetase
VGVTPDLTPSNNAIKMVQIGVSSIGGSGGGGRPDLAQGGGTNPSGSTKARDEIKQLVKPVSTISNSEN